MHLRTGSLIVSLPLLSAIIYKLSENEWTVLGVEMIVGFHIEKEQLDIHYWRE